MEGMTTLIWRQRKHTSDASRLHDPEARGGPQNDKERRQAPLVWNFKPDDPAIVA